MSDPFAPRPAAAADPQHDTLIVPLPAGGSGGQPAAAMAGATSAARSAWRQPVVWAAVAVALAGGVALGAGVTRAGEPGAPETVAGSGVGPGDTGDFGDGAAPADPDVPDGTGDGLADALRQGLADELGSRIREQVPGDLGESLGDLVEDPAVGEQVQQLLGDLITGGGDQG